MSGDPEPKDEPKIFYSEEITVTKLIVLKQQKDPVDDYFDCVSSCDTDNKECHMNVQRNLKKMIRLSKGAPTLEGIGASCQP